MCNYRQRRFEDCVIFLGELFDAVKKHDLEKMKKLLKDGADPTWIDMDGENINNTLTLLKVKQLFSQI